MSALFPDRANECSLNFGYVSTCFTHFWTAKRSRIYKILDGKSKLSKNCVSQNKYSKWLRIWKQCRTAVTQNMINVHVGLVRNSELSLSLISMNFLLFLVTNKIGYGLDWKLSMSHDMYLFRVHVKRTPNPNPDPWKKVKTTIPTRTTATQTTPRQADYSHYTLRKRVLLLSHRWKGSLNSSKWVFRTFLGSLETVLVIYGTFLGSWTCKEPFWEPLVPRGF